jgi:hypothetical protein
MLSRAPGRCSRRRPRSGWPGEDEAFDRHDGGQAIFFAPDIVSDSGMIGQVYMGLGRRAALGIESTTYDAEYERGPIYLDATGLVRTDTFAWPSDDEDPAGPPTVFAFLAWVEIGEDGIERYQHMVYGRYGDPGLARPEAQAEAEQVAAYYVGVWNDADADGAAALYAPDATLSDSVLGVQVSGREAISGLLDDASLMPVRPDHLDEVYPPQALPLGSEDPPPNDAPAVHVYLAPPLWETLTQVWLPLHTTTDCPDASVVALTLDDHGRISAERRFHSLDSLRTCTDPDRLVDGWWADRDLPLPFAERVTGTLQTAAGTIELHNSGPAYDHAIAWAPEPDADSRPPPPHRSSPRSPSTRSMSGAATAAATPTGPPAPPTSSCAKTGPT